MEDLENLGGSSVARVFSEGDRGSLALRSGERRRADLENVGCTHGPQVGDKPVQRWIGNLRAVDVHHRPQETRIFEKRRERRRLDAGMDVGRVHVQRFDYDFAQMSAEDFIGSVLVEGLQARWILVGDDFRFGARRQGDIELLRQTGMRLGFEVVQMDSVLVDGVRVSSTVVRELLAAGKLDDAAHLLGRPYSVSGRVVRGQRLGSRLGFPTANLQLKHNRPALLGIFVVEVTGLSAQPLPGVASLGVRPTVVEAGLPLLEVHLLDFARDIYGEHLQVRFLSKLRDEEKYNDIETLRRQIARDVEAARAFFAARGRSAH